MWIGDLGIEKSKHEWDSKEQVQSWHQGRKGGGKRNIGNRTVSIENRIGNLDVDTRLWEKEWGKAVFLGWEDAELGIQCQTREFGMGFGVWAWDIGDGNWGLGVGLRRGNWDFVQIPNGNWEFRTGKRTKSQGGAATAKNTLPG